LATVDFGAPWPFRFKRAFSSGPCVAVCEGSRFFCPCRGCANAMKGASSESDSCCGSSGGQTAAASGNRKRAGRTNSRLRLRKKTKEANAPQASDVDDQDAAEGCDKCYLCLEEFCSDEVRMWRKVKLGIHCWNAVRCSLRIMAELTALGKPGLPSPSC